MSTKSKEERTPHVFATELDRGETRGLVLACAVLIRDLDAEEHAREIIEAMGLEPSEVEDCGLEEYDTEPVLQFLADMEE